jgi:cytosine/adenosine deaminase-related metal-dependent hydrolase
MPLKSLHPQSFGEDLNQTRLIQAPVVADAFEIHSPGALLVRGQTVLAVGAPESIGQPLEASLVRCPGHLICPALVNAHSHLDLSDLSGIQERAFGPWLAEVIRHRRAQETPGAVEKAVSIGVSQSISGGSMAVGDICGSNRAFEAVSSSDLGGVAFLEFLGHGDRADMAVEDLRSWVAGFDQSTKKDGPGPKPGLSPHAPYSTSQAIYAEAGKMGLPVSTHLAESLEELEWCREHSGIFAELNTKMGAEPRSGPADGRHPVDGYVDLLPSNRGLAVHLNYIEPHHLPPLQRSGVTVVYCPRASAFFGHPHGEAPQHSWRAMRAAGIPVALGTDGRPCLLPQGLAAGRLSILDEVLHLQRTSAIKLDEWLPMATVDGARALGVPEALVCFKPGARPGILALKLASIGKHRLDERAAIQWISTTPQGFLSE